jgi:hypothetical protein
VGSVRLPFMQLSLDGAYSGTSLSPLQKAG